MLITPLFRRVEGFFCKCQPGFPGFGETDYKYRVNPPLDQENWGPLVASSGNDRSLLRRRLWETWWGWGIKWGEAPELGSWDGQGFPSDYIVPWTNRHYYHPTFQMRELSFRGSDTCLGSWWQHSNLNLQICSQILLSTLCYNQFRGGKPLELVDHSPYSFSSMQRE